eukprot:1215348-Rhodomonas_salina.2
MSQPLGSQKQDLASSSVAETQLLKRAFAVSKGGGILQIAELTVFLTPAPSEDAMPYSLSFADHVISARRSTLQPTTITLATARSCQSHR